MISCKIFHTSGITLALSQNCETVVKKCLDFMKDENKVTSFDINYRAKLWSPKEAKTKLNGILPNVDILLSSEKDVDLIFNINKDLRGKCGELLEKFSLKTITLTRGSNPPYTLDENGQEYLGKGNLPQLVDRIGAGDAFDAGFLYGYILGDIEKGIKYGEAMSALKFSIPGDFLIVNKPEVEEFFQRERKLLKR